MGAPVSEVILPPTVRDCAITDAKEMSIDATKSNVLFFLIVINF
jgi:hypothetical protein